MQINIDNFKSLLKKSTLNYTIDAIIFTAWKDRIQSKMINSSRDAISIIDMENNLFTDFPNEEVEFVFSEPNQFIVPYLSTFESENVSCSLKDRKLLLNDGSQKVNLFFDYKKALSHLAFDFNKANFGDDIVTTINIGDTFQHYFQKVKKIGNMFGKIYFGCEENNFYVETTDKTSSVANGLRFNMQEMDFQNFYICIPFQNFSNLMNILDGDLTQYTMSITYIDSKKLGIVYVCNQDESERYFLFSIKE